MGANLFFGVLCLVAGIGMGIYAKRQYYYGKDLLGGKLGDSRLSFSGSFGRSVIAFLYAMVCGAFFLGAVIFVILNPIR